MNHVPFPPPFPVSLAHGVSVVLERFIVFQLAWIGMALCIHHWLAFMGVARICKERGELSHGLGGLEYGWLGKADILAFSCLLCLWLGINYRQADLTWSAMDMLHTPETWHRYGAFVLFS